MITTLQRSRNRSRSLARRRARKSDAALQLFVERLESREVLATVTAVDPPANSHDAAPSADVVVTFDQAVTAATDNTLVLHSSQRGQLAGEATSVSLSGTTATHDPTNSFFAGEQLQVTVTTGVTTAGGAAVPQSWQFRAAATAGSGEFVETGQMIGDPAGNTPSQGIELGDLDGDGDLDAFVANAGVANRVYLNNGGVFTSSGQELGNHASAEVALGDLDGDGDLDAVVANTGGQGNRVWSNNGSGVFIEAQSFGNSNSGGVQLADLDRDGDLDAFVANIGQPNRVWTNNGGVLNDSGQGLGNHASQSVDLGDVDGDGDLDAYVVNNQYQPNRVWVNDGNGRFGDSGQTLGGHASQSVDLGDIDGDGDLDAFVANVDQHNRVWLNTGDGVFTDSGQLLARDGTGLGNRYTRTNWIELADMDADGDLDAFTVNNNGGPNRIWTNDGAGMFTDSGQDLWLVPGGSFLQNPASTGVALGDVDGDGDVDALVSNTSVGDGTGSVNRLYLNRNLTPTVSLNVDTTSIAEAGGVATVTATLSAAHSQPVTVDLEISGTATAADDYTASGNQIVIAAGDTSGAVTITAVQDSVDEPDEAVNVSISSITNGQGSGSVSIIIVDDDEPLLPDVTLSVDAATIDEDGGTATFTATLSEASTAVVTVELALSGTATSGTDYTSSGTQIAIPAGSTTGSITVTAVDDDEDEANETVVVEIASVAGGNQSGSQQATTTIVDDDAPAGFMVSSLTATPSGFVAQLSTELDPSELNLYDTQSLGLGTADATLVGAASGPVRGSLVVDDSLRRVTFIKAGGPLEADSYTVTLRSGTDGFQDAGGRLLDGNGDGTAGDDYSSSFDVSAPAAGTVTLSIPDFTRGPGQAVDLPANTTDGIPVTISEGNNVRAVDFRIGYDPTKLSISGATVGADAPAGATVILNTMTPGLAIFVFFSSASLPAGSSTLINLEATVPTENGGDVYGTQQVLDLHGATVSDGNDNESPVLVDDAVQLVSYFSDVSGNGRVNAADASQVARFAALIDSGFSGSILTDPIVAGDVSGNNRINAADASLVAQFAALIDVPVIPPIPSGVLVAGVPRAFLPTPARTPAESSANLLGDDSAVTFLVVEEFSSSRETSELDKRLIDEALTDEDSFLASLEELLDGME